MLDYQVMTSSASWELFYCSIVGRCLRNLQVSKLDFSKVMVVLMF